VDAQAAVLASLGWLEGDTLGTTALGVLDDVTTLVAGTLLNTGRSVRHVVVSLELSIVLVRRDVVGVNVELVVTTRRALDGWLFRQATSSAVATEAVV
jgi:hypothetical protein